MSEEQQLAVVPEAGAAVTKYTAEHAAEFGLPSPQAINFMVQTAKLILNSSLITQDMGSNPTMIQANAIAKMMVGHQLGIQGIQALQEVTIVKGKIFISYPQLITQMMKKGFRLKWEERSLTRAAIRVTPPEDHLMMEELFEYTIEDAQRAGLAGNDNYKKQPRVMLSARVVSEAFRMTGGASNIYTPEERMDMVEFQTDAPEPDRPMEPEQRRQMRSEVLDNKITELRKAQDVTPVVVEDAGGYEEINSEHVDSDIRDAENPTLFDDTPEPPAWATDIRNMYDKLMAAGRQGFVKDTLAKFGLQEIGDVTEETSMGVIADFEDNLTARPIKPPAKKGSGFKL